jgi:GR25 family glycosyltransferase involved in LPS biosynthesis
MKKYVITIMNNPASVEASNRCIESAKKFGYDVQIFPAITPANDLHKLFNYHELPADEFKDNPYSRTEPTMACFLSHHALWCVAHQLQETIMILEHDAVFTSELPNVEVDELVNFGKPSFGNFQTKVHDALYPLFSKGGSYLGGAHAYAVSPKGAKMLLESARKTAKPTDIFIGKSTVPGAKEYYPWPVVVNDSVSTIQKELGCRAKHNRVVPV